MCGGIDIGCDLEEVRIHNIAKEMGFEICGWGPDPEDECEGCDKNNIQLYCHSDGFGEGIYWCMGCILEMHQENERVGKLMDDFEKQGHTYHCAARMACGDGECECELKGILPTEGSISRKILHAMGREY